MVWILSAVAVPAETALTQTRSDSRALPSGKAHGRPLLLAGLQGLARGVDWAQFSRFFDAASSRRQPGRMPSQLPRREAPVRAPQLVPAKIKEVHLPPDVPQADDSPRHRRAVAFLLKRPDITDRYDELIEKYASFHGLDPRLIKAVIAGESAFRRKARSPVGALGLMQLMPPTAKEMGVDGSLLTDPDANIRAGAAYLSHLFKRILRRYRIKAKSFADAPLWVVGRVLAAYNAGPRFLYRSRTFRATRRYVKKVLGYYRSRAADLRLIVEPDANIPLLRPGRAYERSLGAARWSVSRPTPHLRRGW